MSEVLLTKFILQPRYYNNKLQEKEVKQGKTDRQTLTEEKGYVNYFKIWLIEIDFYRKILKIFFIKVSFVAKSDKTLTHMKDY